MVQTAKLGGHGVGQKVPLSPNKKRKTVIVNQISGEKKSLQQWKIAAAMHISSVYLEC